MESYSLLMLFATMVVIWWFTWGPWRKRPSDPAQRDDDTSDDHKGP